MKDQGQPIPIDDLFEDPDLDHWCLSYEGTKLAAIDYRASSIVVRDLLGRNNRRIQDSSVPFARSLWWNRDGYLLWQHDEDGRENTSISWASVGEVRTLRMPDGVRTHLVRRSWKRGSAFFLSNRRQRDIMDVYTLDLASGRTRPLFLNPGFVAHWFLADDGSPVGAVGPGADGSSVVYRADLRGSALHAVAEYDRHCGLRVFGATPSGSALWVAVARDETSSLCRLDLANGLETLVCANRDVDIHGPLLCDFTGELLGTLFLKHDMLDLQALDERFGREWRRLQAHHEGDVVMVAMDGARRTFVVEYDDDRRPGLQILWRPGKKPRVLQSTYPRLRAEQLATMKPVTVRARDGLQLPSYLTMPHVASAAIPMVLLVHGGPWSRDVWGFDPEVQFLASRGYAVLQVNYRGSAGFGRSFAQAGWREFGRKMHDDLVDAARWAVSEGFADPGRIGIMGASYGGYAALLGATHSPGVFAASCSIMGPSDLADLIRSFPAYWKNQLAATWHTFVGDPADPEDLADMRLRSPLYAADRAKTPVAIVQTTNDPRVPRSQSDRMVAALRSRGVSVDYLLIEGEGHSLADPEHRRMVYSFIEHFLAQHLRPSSIGSW